MLKDKFGFNFWPSFTDLMLSFVLVVLIILFVVTAFMGYKTSKVQMGYDFTRAIPIDNVLNLAKSIVSTQG